MILTQIKVGQLGGRELDKIDFVIPWVNMDDPVWNKKRNDFLKLDISESKDDMRFRDYGTLKYWFRSIEENAPWVNKIYFITDNQTPEWLNVNHPKIVALSHEDYIPSEYLPTFNSNVIEMNLFRIKELSERFVLFNDDMFLNSLVKPEDFYKNDMIREFAIYSNIPPIEDFSHILVNNAIILNNHFSKRKNLKKNFFKIFSPKYGIQNFRSLLTLPWPSITGYYTPHLPSPHKKSMFEKVYHLEPDSFEKTFKNNFRGIEDINHWLIRCWQIEEGNFYPQNINFGKYYLLSEPEKIAKDVTKKNSKAICINDENLNVEEFDHFTHELIAIFEKRYPNKSKFEN